MNWLSKVGQSLLLLIILGLSACTDHPWNNPYPENQAKANFRYTSFISSPKTLDPARSYSNDEAMFIAQIYEPPLQYHYLKRPFTLEPLTAVEMPKITLLSKTGQPLPANTSSDSIGYTLYEITIKPNIYYQPHPAFAKDKEGHYYYLNLQPNQINKVRNLEDFKYKGTRELTAEDYVYQIKRLAQPGVNSPIFGLMSTKIEGLEQFSRELNKHSVKGQWLDLRLYPLAGVKVIDRYRYQILLKGNYRQFIYWLALHFFAPVPWEADKFYSQPGMNKRNLTFDWQPVGTGPYILSENNPNRRMVLAKNPYFHPEYFPTEGEPGDKAAGYLINAGKRLPLIDKVIFTLEKETIPRWNKFLQGYYDQSTISSDSFDQAIQIDAKGRPLLTPELKNKGIYLQTAINNAIAYIGFNMLDDVVGGKSERARKLRLAITIAINFEEYINIFMNGRGTPAQGPLPPGIFGFQEGPAGINPWIYKWQNNQPTRKSLREARRLLKEAGYPNGVDPKTGEPLILNYDVYSTGGPDEKAVLSWIRAQFAKIGIQLNIRATEYNRFQQKMQLGEGQIYLWGWIADYPDPENFFFLLYGPNGKAKFSGENAANYSNPAFDKLFDEMKNLPNNAKRQEVINKMLAIVQHDAPWAWGYYQKDFVLSHSWINPIKLNVIAYNIVKYESIRPKLRAVLQLKWNHRILWPLGIFFLLLVAISLPVFVRYWQKERKSIKHK